MCTPKIMYDLKNMYTFAFGCVGCWNIYWFPVWHVCAPTECVLPIHFTHLQVDWTPAHRAVDGGHEGCLRLLIEVGADMRSLGRAHADVASLVTTAQQVRELAS